MKRVPLAASLLVLLAAFLVPLERAGDPLPEAAAVETVAGETLLRGSPAPGEGSVTSAMPLATLGPAIAFGRLGWRGGRLAWLSLLTATALAAAALASELAGWPAAVLAAAILLGSSRGWVAPGNTLHAGYALLVLLAAWTFVRLARETTPRRGAFAGLALGATLLYRSPLLFVPPLLLLLLKKRPFRLAGGIPLLMLLPWIALNARLHGTFNPAEHMRADTNIVSGALGLTVNIEGDIRALAPEADLRPGRVLGWAVRRVLAHPLDYAGAVVSRWRLVFGLTPWLFLAALAAAAVMRKDPGARATAALAAYLLLVHSAMPIAPHYMIPFQYLLAVLAASGASALLLPKAGPLPGARPLAAGLLGLAVAACAGAEVLVLRFSSRERPVVLDARAEIAARPLDGEAALRHAYALAMAGHPQALAILRQGEESAASSRHRLPFLRAAAAVRAGDLEKARTFIASGAAAWAATSATTHRLVTPLERDVAARLRPPPISELFADALKPLTAAERRSYLEAVAAVAGDERAADALAYGAALELQAGREAAALPLWRRAVEANPASACSLPTEEFGGPERADLPPEFFSLCLERLPKDAKLWTDRGVARAKRGLPGAEADLLRALELDPGSKDASMTLEYVRSKRP